MSQPDAGIHAPFFPSNLTGFLLPSETTHNSSCKHQHPPQAPRAAFSNLLRESEAACNNSLASYDPRLPHKHAVPQHGIHNKHQPQPSRGSRPRFPRATAPESLCQTRSPRCRTLPSKPRTNHYPDVLRPSLGARSRTPPIEFRREQISCISEYWDGYGNGTWCSIGCLCIPSLSLRDACVRVGKLWFRGVGLYSAWLFTG